MGFGRRGVATAEEEEEDQDGGNWRGKKDRKWSSNGSNQTKQNQE